MLAKLSVCVLLVCSISAWKWGWCPDFPLQENFDLSQYLGQWHEAARMKGTQFESGDCGWANYSLRENGHVKVVNTQILPNGQTDSIEGDAYQTKKNPAALRVAFFKPFYGDYNVIATDYETYSVVYSCSNYLFFYTEYAWILAREATYDTIGSEQLESLASINISEDEMMIHDLQACPADPPSS